jgi:hypothetical protein
MDKKIIALLGIVIGTSGLAIPQEGFAAMLIAVGYGVALSAVIMTPILYLYIFLYRVFLEPIERRLPDTIRPLFRLLFSVPVNRLS